MSEVSYKFALETANLLQNNEFAQAITLCEAGLLKYPNYPLAMVLLAKAYYLSDEIDSAKIIIDAAEKRYPVNLSIINAKRQIYGKTPELKNKENSVNIKSANFLYKIDSSYSQDNCLPVKNNFNVDPDEHIFTFVNKDNVASLLEENLKNEASQKFNIDDLSQIAKQVETAKISPVVEFEGKEEKDGNYEVIVASETMAKIFVKQKAYKKAIKVYEILISEKPDKKEYFAQLIKELEEKL